MKEKGRHGICHERHEGFFSGKIEKIGNLAGVKQLSNSASGQGSSRITY